MKYYFSISKILFFLIFVHVNLYTQNIIKGKVLDDVSGEAIPGATISLIGKELGTISSADGTFVLSLRESFPWNIRVGHTAYESKLLTIDQDEVVLEIRLIPGLKIGEELVITASRKSEKVTDSPASISILTAQKIETQAASGEPLELIKSINGVQLNQQGINRSNLTLRGASGVNQTTAQLLKDFRPLVNPGDYYLSTARSTISDIDIDRIEVIRGPSGALYGPGVSAGVVHFLTKNPIDFPGTTISLTGGEQSVFKANIRHADHNETETFGYKINVGQAVGNDWVLNSKDAAAADGGKSYGNAFISEKEELLDIPGNLIEKFSSFFVEGTLEFRPSKELNLVWVTSMAENKGNDRITPGDLYRYWRVWNNQARVRYKNLFGAINYQITPGTNGSISSPGYTGQYAETPGGNSILYDDGDQYYLDAQLQYVFDAEKINTEFTFGGDYKSSVMNGNIRNAGRFHEADDYIIYGGYLQANTKLIKDKLDLILATRFDGFSAFDDTGFSPRLGLVYKPDASSQIRASYNRSFVPSGQVRAFLDFTIATTPWGKIQVLGSHAPITFNNTVTDFFPGFLPDGYNGIGSGLNPIYSFISKGPLAGAGLPPALLAYLQSQSITGSTAGTLNVFLPGGKVGGLVSDVKLLETDAAKLAITQAYELGYKGVIAKKLSASVDLYYMKLKNFESNALGVSPFVSIPNVGTDLKNSIIANLDAQQIANLGGNINQIAEIFAQIAKGAFPGPIGAVQTDQAQEVPGTQVNFGFQSIGNLSYWGMDFGLEYYIKNDFSVYVNYGYINQNVFSAEDIGEVADGFNLNTPKNKIRIGLNYFPKEGFYGGIHYLNDDEFMSTNGIYTGIAEARSLADLNIGYKFNEKLKISINASNLFNNKYQAFPRLPEIGRLVLVNGTYSLGQL